MKTSWHIDFAQPIHLPPFWLNNPTIVPPLDSAAEGSGNEELLSTLPACPLKMKWASESGWWQLPIEPVVSINSKNNIVKRSVLKAGINDSERRGTVKELWSQDDYEIAISGIFICKDNKLPDGDIRRLRAYCEGREAVEVQSPLFTLFNIRRIASRVTSSHSPKVSKTSYSSSERPVTISTTNNF